MFEPIKLDVGSCSITLVRYMGGDDSVVEAARLTSNSQAKGENAQLINYLMRNKHMSPFEFCTLEFEIEAPIYVARQWMRHRTAAINEISARYSEVEDKFEKQTEWRGQSKSNRQGSDGTVSHEELRVTEELHTVEEAAFYEYQRRLESGVAREQARTCLPLSTMTKWRWCVNLRNCLHFLLLRTDHHAQKEIREIAYAMLALVREVAPLCLKAWENYEKYAVTFSRKDIQLLSSLKRTIEIGKIDSSLAKALGMSKGETEELKNKLNIIFGNWEASDAGHSEHL